MKTEEFDSDSDAFKALTEARKERHAEWHENNRKIIDDSDINFIDKSEALLFRDKIKADFYPSTGRWKYGVKIYRGGAKSFLNWWVKNNK